MRINLTDLEAALNLQATCTSTEVYIHAWKRVPEVRIDLADLENALYQNVLRGQAEGPHRTVIHEAEVPRYVEGPQRDSPFRCRNIKKDELSTPVPSAPAFVLKSPTHSHQIQIRSRLNSCWTKLPHIPKYRLDSTHIGQICHTFTPDTD